MDDSEDVKALQLRFLEVSEQIVTLIAQCRSTAEAGNDEKAPLLQHEYMSLYAELHEIEGRLDAIARDPRMH